MRKIYGWLAHVALNFRWYMVGTALVLVGLVGLTRFVGAEWSLFNRVESLEKRQGSTEERLTRLEQSRVPVERLDRLSRQLAEVSALLAAAAADRPTPNTGSPQPQTQGSQE